MTALIVIGCVVLALFLLSLVRLGAWAEYSAEGFLARVKFGFFSFQVFPVKREKREKKPPKAKKEASKPEGGEKKGGSFALLKEMLPLAAEAAGRLKRKVRIDKLYLDLLSASSDPAAAAMSFGCANAAIGMIWPLLEHNFNIKDRRIRTSVDFQQAEPTVYLCAEASLTVGQLVALAVVLLFQFLRRYRAYQAKQKAEAIEKTQKEAV